MIKCLKEIRIPISPEGFFALKRTSVDVFNSRWYRKWSKTYWRGILSVWPWWNVIDEMEFLGETLDDKMMWDILLEHAVYDDGYMTFRFKTEHKLYPFLRRHSRDDNAIHDVWELYHHCAEVAEERADRYIRREP